VTQVTEETLWTVLSLRCPKGTIQLSRSFMGATLLAVVSYDRQKNRGSRQNEATLIRSAVPTRSAVPSFNSRNAARFDGVEPYNTFVIATQRKRSAQRHTEFERRDSTPQAGNVERHDISPNADQLD
jgi:hypothetical protein